MDYYPVKLDLRIDWSELDLFGHVNNVAFFKYIQASRVNYWDIIGLSRMHAESKIGAMLASTACDFKRPLFYPGNINIQARVSFIKNTSFGIEHLITNDSGEPAAEARDVIVIYDYNKHEKVPVPDELRKIIEQLEGKKF